MSQLDLSIHVPGQTQLVGLGDYTQSAQEELLPELRGGGGGMKGSINLTYCSEIHISAQPRGSHGGEMKPRTSKENKVKRTKFKIYCLSALRTTPVIKAAEGV